MKRLPLCFPSEVSSRGTRDVGIMDLLSGLLVVKQILKLWPEKGFGWRQTSFLFFKSNSSRFPYIFRLLDFFFDTEYYTILMSNSFTIVHFRTLARPLQYLLFCFSLKKIINLMIYFLLYVFDNNDSNPPFHEERLPAIAASSDFG